MTIKIIVIKKDTDGNDMEVYNSDFQEVKDETVSDLTLFLKDHQVK